MNLDLKERSNFYLFTWVYNALIITFNDQMEEILYYENIISMRRLTCFNEPCLYSQLTIVTNSHRPPAEEYEAKMTL